MLSAPFFFNATEQAGAKWKVNHRNSGIDFGLAHQRTERPRDPHHMSNWVDTLCELQRGQDRRLKVGEYP